MKKGLQLYSIRALCGQDLHEGLKAAAAIGFEGVEFAGFFGNTAETVAGWLKECGLEALAAHIPPEEMFEHTDEMIAYHKVIGNSRLICPWYDLKTEADVDELAGKLLAIAPKIKAAGMKLYYHNHAHEFQKDNGAYLIDLLAKKVGGDVLSLEFDVYWVYRGGENPLRYLETYKDRADVFHAKDGTMAGGTIAGEGNVPLKEVCDLASSLGMQWAVVESEASDELYPQLIAATKDYVYLNSLL